MMEILRAIRVVLRSLKRNPLSTTFAVGTLALALGANTVIFSLVDAVLLRPLQYPDEEELVVIWETDQTDQNQPWRVAPANFLDWKEQADAFEGMAGFGAYAATLTGRGDPVQVRGGVVTPDYFEVLGVPALLGRTFRVEEDVESRTVVIGYELWQSKFGGSRDVLGQSLALDGEPLTVVGVMPAGIYPSWPVNGPRIHFQSEYQDVWVLVPAQRMSARRSHVFGVLARMKPGVDLEGAQRQMDTIARRLAAEYSENKDEGALVRPLLDEVVGETRFALYVLFGAVGVVLLIACSNVSSLLLARLAARRQEFGLRLALGAGNVDLARRFLVEALAVTGLGAMGGFLLALVGQTLIGSLLPLDVPRLADSRLDIRVLLFMISISLGVALFLALVPYLAGGRKNLIESLREGSRGTEPKAPQTLRGALVVAQVSLAVVLSIAAGLLTQSFWKLERLELGFRTDRLLVSQLVLPSRYSSWQQVRNFYRELLDRVRQTPGAETAQIAYDIPTETNWLTGFSIEGEPRDDPPPVQLRIVSPGYFSDLGFALQEGREFGESDDPGHPGVAVVNQAFVRRFIPEGRALGRTILSTAASSNWNGQMPDRFEIVGVVNDIQVPRLAARDEPFFYVCAWQFPRPEMTFLVRTAGDPLDQVAMLRQQIWAVDPDLPIGRVTTIDHVIAEAITQPRVSMFLMALFGGIALCLALVGVNGLIAVWVASRTREIGVRMALGAKRGDVFALILGKVMRLVLPGVGIGLVCAILASGLIRSQLFRVSALDGLTLIVVPLIVLLAGLLACPLPAMKASRVDPATALRSD